MTRHLPCALLVLASAACASAPDPAPPAGPHPEATAPLVLPAPEPEARERIPAAVVALIQRLGEGSRTLKEDAAAIARSGSVPGRRAATERLFEMGLRIGAADWREAHRAELEQANRSVNIEATPEQFEAQLVLWQDETLSAVFEAMGEIGGAEIADFLLAEAARSGSSTVRRRAALEHADRVVDRRDPERREVLAQAHRDVGAAIASEMRRPGTLPDASVIVASMRAGFKRCYQQALAIDPQLSVKVRLTLTVDGSGFVKDATVSEGAPAGLVECVKGIGKSARFAPPQGGGTTLVVPLNFSSAP
jgi:hypothetical protein